MLNRLVHTSTGHALQERTLTPSSRPSVRRRDVSRRQNISCRILIPVTPSLATRACPLTNRKRQSFYNITTFATHLARWVKSIYFTQFFTVPFALITNVSLKRPHRSITNRLGQSSILDHPTQVQILHNNHIKTPHQISCHLVDMVLSTICYFCMQPGHTKTLPVPPSTSHLTARQNALSFSKLFLVIPKILWIRNSFPIRKCCQSVDAQINTCTLARFRQWLNLFVEDKRYKVPPSRILGYRHRRWSTCKCPGPSNLKPTYFGKYQVPVFVIPLEGRFCVFSRLLATLLLVRRIADTFLEEVFVSCLKLSQGLLRWYTRYIVQPRVVRLLFKPGQGCRCINITKLNTFTIAIFSKIKCPVVHISTAPKYLSKLCFLLLCWITPICISKLHMPVLLRVKNIVNNKFSRKEPAFLPALKDGVSTLEEFDESPKYSISIGSPNSI